MYSRTVDMMSTSAKPPLRRRSLADDLRHRSTEQVEQLLRRRPDLAVPAPATITEMASRAGLADSLRMALHNCDRRELAVARAVALGGDPTSLAEVTAHLQGGSDIPTAAEVAQVADRLHLMALLWSDGSTRHPLRYLTDATNAVVTGELAMWQPEVTPEIGSEVSMSEVDEVAGHQGLLSVALVGNLIDRAEDLELALTRDGALAQRAADAAAAAMGLPLWQLAMWLELCWASGLMGPTADGELLVPTVAGRVWAELESAAAWPVLVISWWHSQWDWAAFTTAEEQRPAVLGEDHNASRISSVRQAWAHLLAEAAPGGVVVNVADVLADRHPLWGAAQSEAMVAATAEQAELLGITGRGALSSMGRASQHWAAVDPAEPIAPPELVATATDMLPAAVDHVLVQGDSTIVAPGPLVPALAQRLAAVAKVESTGGATVYRISVASIERALDRGWQGEEILEMLTAASITPLPQPVVYMVTDTAARHGRIRVGPATSTVVTSDPADLALVMAALASSPIGITAISETVAVSEVSQERLVMAIRDAGVAVSLAGAGAALAPKVAPVPHPPTAVSGLSDGYLRGLAAALTTPPPDRDLHDVSAPDIARLHPAMVQSVLLAAITERGRVWVKYADNAGRSTVRLVTPIELAGGVLHALDVMTARTRTFTVTRVIGVRAQASEEAP